MSVANALYNYAAWGYTGMLVIVVACLYRGQRNGDINLWDCVRTTKDGVTFTDRRKLFETGAFVVSTIAFSYLVVVDKMSEIFLTVYMGMWVTSAALRDRAQLKEKALVAGTDTPK